MLDRCNKVISRVLLDEFGLVFQPGYAWFHPDPVVYRLVVLPGEVVYHDWWDGWWEQNWRFDDWSWVNMYRHGNFHPVMAMKDGDSICYFAA